MPRNMDVSNIVERKKYMKKRMLIGIFSPLLYFWIYHFLRYCPLFEYSEKYGAIQNAMLFILPALPGVALAFLIVEDSVKKYLKSVGICFIISLVVFILYIQSGVELMIFRAITGYEEGSPGEGILILVTFMSYIISCFVGVIISGIITGYRQNKSKNE